METNFLENKKVNVKVIQKYRTGFNKDSDGSTLYTGCKQVFQAPTNQYDRLVPLLTEEEQRFFEDKLGLNKGDLSFQNKEKSFWREFKVTLDKKGRILDLSDAEDNLAYRVLKASNTVAKSKGSINVLQHTFYLVSEDEELDASVKISDRFEEASKLFTTISKSSTRMENVLRLLGKKIAPDWGTKALKSELVKIIEQRAKVPGQPNIDEFIKVASDKDFDIKIFIMDAIELGEVFIEGTTYKLKSSDIIGYDLYQAIDYFNNPKNQQSKLLVEDRVRNNKGK